MAAEGEAVEKKMPVKEKKPRAPKEKKPKAPAHPPYFEMIKEALLALDEKSGSSPYAIAKYMEEKHKAVLPANFKKILSVQLKNSASRGKLIKIRASYKLAKAAKSTKEKVPTIIMEKKTRSATAARIKAEAAVKSPPAAVTSSVVPKTKKSTSPVKVKQPRSIRSSVGRKAKTAVAVA